MSEQFDAGGTSSTNPAPKPAAPARARGGFVGRFFAALLVIVITTLITLLVVAVGFWNLGFTPDSAQQIADGRAALATAQAQSSALQLQNNVIQTQIADLDRRGANERESLDELRKTVADLNGLRAQLAASDLRSATAVAAARSSVEQVAALATAEAGRVTLLADIARRSERVERFLTRLSDISGDAAQDIGGATASALPASPTPFAPTPSSAPTPTEAAATTLPATAPPATAPPAAATATSAPSSAATAAATATSAATRTATRVP